MLDAERVRQLYRSGWLEIFGQLLAGLALVLLFFFSLPRFLLLVWGAAMVAIGIGRFLLWNAYRRRRPPVTDAGRWERAFIGGVLLHAAAWGVAVWLFPDGTSMERQAIMAALVVALSAATFSLLAPSPGATRAFLVPVIGALAVHSFASGFWTIRVMGALQLVYLPAAMLAARMLHTSLVENFRLRVEAETREAALAASQRRAVASEERYRRLFESSEDAMWVMRGQRFSMANPAACRIFGLGSPEEFEGVHPAELSPEMQPDGRPSMEKAPELMRRALERGYQRFEWTHVRRDGSTFPTEVTLTRLEGGKDELFAVLRDITERKLAEDELRRTQALAEEASRAKSEFLATMSHEIRTPLNAVLGMTDILQTTELDADQREFASTISGSGQALLELIDDILDFSKIEAGHLELEREPVDLPDLVDQVVRLLQTTADLKGIEILARTESVRGRRFVGDAARLRQVLVNLVGNAVKFTEHGRVEVALAAGERKSPRTELRVEVRDTGIGIAPEALEHLFSPFKQADGSTTRRFGGTGLGLAISRSLVEAMGGRIGAESTPEEGSVFWVDLRLPEEAPGPPPEPTPTTSPGRARLEGRVLVVEDSAPNQVLARRMLQLMGLDVVIADNGEVGVGRYREGEYDLVLMDLQMPVLDGYESTRRIREIQRETGRFCPVVAVTANVTSADRARCDEIGFDGFLAKPYTLKGLRATVESSLGAVAPA